LAAQSHIFSCTRKIPAKSVSLLVIDSCFLPAFFTIFCGMNILVTNDDGIDSPGIDALARALRTVGTVMVVAPDRQQSAVGHALTVSRPLRATKVRRDGVLFGFAVDGTPADCVKLGATTLLDAKPDLVVSGINHGSNTSVNILYSGTVSAASEAMLLGIPAIAVSIDSLSYSTDCTAAAEITAEIAAKVPLLALPLDTLLNVNVPAIEKENIKGVKITRQGTSGWEDNYERRTDPMGREYFWLSGNYHVRDLDHSTDEGALKAGYVSVTPVRYRLTNDEELQRLTSAFS
jgi:5'-nucleotidase